MTTTANPAVGERPPYLLAKLKAPRDLERLPETRSRPAKRTVRLQNRAVLGT